MPTKKILIAPLDWGLGHAARCIPVIHQLLQKKLEVILGGSGISGKLLQKEFPHLPYEEIPGYDVHYSSKLPMSITMLRQAPGILRSIREEKKWLEEKIERDKIHAVISDHRYGLHNKKIYSVFMAHQLFISSGNNDILEPVLWKVNKSYIENFNDCWIPDMEDGPNASGKLAHKFRLPFKHHFIGLLSRLKPVEKKGNEAKYRACFILSGLEPLRTELEHIIIEQVSSLQDGKYILIRGTDIPLKKQPPDQLEIIDMADTEVLNKIAGGSEIILSRAGYSSIMDFLTAGMPALLVPTPGQTEQEYLARYHLETGNFYSIPQDQLNLANDLPMALSYRSEFINNPKLLGLAIDDLIKSMN